MNLKLIAHKTYAFGGVIYRAGVSIPVEDALAQELLSHVDDNQGPVFVEAVEEAGEPVEAKPTPRKTTVVFGNKPGAGKKVEGQGGGKEGTDLKTVTV